MKLHGVLDKVKSDLTEEEFVNFCNETDITEFEESECSTTSAGIVASEFDWTKTKHGHDYWNDIFKRLS